MSPSLPSRHNPEWKSTETAVRDELDRILASHEFAGAHRLCRFLRFAVERTLAVDRESLKESVIGAEVFDREPGYDPKADPIVRTAALRLRAKLDEYYQQPGRWYAVRIAMPKGAYLATFEPRPQPMVLPALAPVETKPRIGGRRWVILAAGLAALAIAASLVVLLRPPPGGQPVQATVTSYPGHQQQPALSPDGSQVAFVWEGESGNNRDIYVTMASGGSPRRITTDPGADDYPAWSPDGSTIAFVRENRALMLVTPLGTNERRLTSAYDSKLSWSPDGRRIVFSDWLPNGGPLAVFAADAATGARRQVTAPGQVRPGDAIAEISPNGQEVAFARSDVGASAVYRIPIGGGEPRLVCQPSHSGITGLTWAPDGRNIAFSTVRGGASLIWSVPASGGRAQPVPLTSEDNRNLSFGRSMPAQLVWEHWFQDSNIWRLDLTTHKAERIIASTRLDSSPQFSPDSRSIVFVSDRTGNYQLWRATSDGGNPVQLTRYSAEYPGSARWSPDGSRIAFDLRAGAGRAIFVLDLATGTARQWTPWREGSRPSWSHDGRWIYYGDRTPENAFDIWRVSAAAPAAPERITTGGGSDPFDSPDGETIYFTKGHGELWNVAVAGGKPAQVLPAGVQGGWYSVTARGIFFADLYPGGGPALEVPRTPKPIRLLPYDLRRPIEVGKIEGQILRDTPDFTVSPDGRTALFSILETSTSQIRMLTMLP